MRVARKRRKPSRKDLFNQCANGACDVKRGALFDVKALQLMKMSPYNDATGVGKSEQAVRHMMGIDLTPLGTSSSIDIDEPNFKAEIKHLGKSWGVRLNKHGYNAAQHCMELIRSKGLTTNGELNQRTIASLDDELRQEILETLRPSNVLADVDNMILTNDNGYIVIDRTEYDTAFIKPTVTQHAKVKLQVCPSYVRERANSSVVTSIAATPKAPRICMIDSTGNEIEMPSTRFAMYDQHDRRSTCTFEHEDSWSLKVSNMTLTTT